MENEMEIPDFYIFVPNKFYIVRCFRKYHSKDLSEMEGNVDFYSAISYQMSTEIALQDDTIFVSDTL